MYTLKSQSTDGKEKLKVVYKTECFFFTWIHVYLYMNVFFKTYLFLFRTHISRVCFQRKPQVNLYHNERVCGANKILQNTHVTVN